MSETTMRLLADSAACPVYKPSFTEQLQHLSFGGAIAMIVLMVCVTVVVVIAWVKE